MPPGRVQIRKAISKPGTNLVFLCLQVLVRPQEEMALPFEGVASLLTVGTAAYDLDEGFAHMLDNMEMIGHDTGTRQTQLDRLAEGTTHIHAHRFDAVWLI